MATCSSETLSKIIFRNKLHPTIQNKIGLLMKFSPAMIRTMMSLNVVEIVINPNAASKVIRRLMSHNLLHFENSFWK